MHAACLLSALDRWKPVVTQPGCQRTDVIACQQRRRERTEPPRVLRTPLRLSHVAVTGEENRTDGLRTPDAATNHAGTRTTVPGSVARHTRMPATVALQLAAL